MKFKKPVLQFKIMSKEECRENIKMFLGDSLDSFTSNNIINYFQLEKENLIKDIDLEIYNAVEKFYNNDNLTNRKNELIKLWHEKSQETLDTMAKVFDYKYSGEDMYTVSISINPVCPRYINESSFDIWVHMNDQEAIGNIVHELLHFYWFHYWDSVIHKLTESEKEFPTLTWVFSEIAIDSLITQTELRNIISNTMPAYNYFYDIQYKGQSLIEMLRKLFRENNLEGFMKRGMELIQIEEVTNQLIR